jgi:hypothetical protein
VRLSCLASLAVLSATALAGCATEPALTTQAAVTPPAWAKNVVAALAMLYPPAQTRLYVVKAPPGVTDVLRVEGYGVVEGRAARTAQRDGYRFSIQTRDLGDGSIAVIAHVGQQTLSRAYLNGQAVTGWSFDLTGATEAMKARVDLIQNPPRRVVLPPQPQPQPQPQPGVAQ